MGISFRRTPSLPAARQKHDHEHRCPDQEKTKEVKSVHQALRRSNSARTRACSSAVNCGGSETSR